MDSTTRLQQKKLIKRTQRRLNRLIDLLRKVHLSKRSNHADNDLFQEFVRRSLAKDMFNTGFSSGPFGLTTSSALETAALDATVEPEVEMDLSTVCLGKFYSLYEKFILFVCLPADGDIWSICVPTLTANITLKFPGQCFRTGRSLNVA